MENTEKIILAMPVAAALDGYPEMVYAIHSDLPYFRFLNSNHIGGVFLMAAFFGRVALRFYSLHPRNTHSWSISMKLKDGSSKFKIYGNEFIILCNYKP